MSGRASPGTRLPGYHGLIDSWHAHRTRGADKDVMSTKVYRIHTLVLAALIGGLVDKLEAAVETAAPTLF